MRNVLLGLLLILNLLPATAGGKQEEFTGVEGKENWFYDYDLSTLADGKYNLMIRAVDKAGNVSVTGPFNINVDPKSDIPQVTIISPSSGLRTSGSLNVVGTAFDDDSVDFVEVKLGEEGEVIKAKGNRYWSHFFNISDLPDGEFRVFARATDVNGIESSWVSSNFHLDQYRPVNRVTSHTVGAILQGQVTFAGEIEEPNKISKVFVGFDNQLDLKETGATLDAAVQMYKFSVGINTKDLTDGPHILWMKSVNALGTDGLSAFLFFVKNSPPDIQIIRPVQDTRFPGIGYIAGAVFDGVGIESLTWEVDANLKGDIPLIPGNPYWAFSVDFSEEFKKSDVRDRTVKIKATDKIGNVITKEVRIQLDREADRPVVHLFSPTNKSQTRKGMELVGWISDDDGAQSIAWSIENGESGTLESTGGFRIPITPKTAGNQKLTLVAKDINGLESQPLRVEFVYVPEPPLVRFDKMLIGTRRVDYYPGLMANDPKINTLEGRVLSADKIGNIQYKLNNRPFAGTGTRPGAAGEFAFAINMEPKDLNVGRNQITIRVEDTFKQQKDYYTTFMFNSMELFDGINYIHFLDDRVSQEGRVVLQPNSPPLQAIFTPGEELELGVELKVEVVPASNLVQVEILEQATGFYLLNISAIGEGISPPSKIRITAPGGVPKESRDLLFVTDTTPPAFELTAPLTGSWVQTQLPIQGTLSEIGKVESLEYSLDEGKTFQTLPLPPPPAQNFGATGGRSVTVVQPKPELVLSKFDTKVNISALGDGRQIIILRSRDNAGNESLRPITFFKDTSPPVLNLVTPFEERSVDGTMTLVGEWSDNGPLGKVEFTSDGKTWIDLGNKPQFKTDVDFSKFKIIPKEFAFRGTDISGNVSLINPQILINSEVDKPKIELQIPQEAEVLRGDFFISGLAVDDDGVKEIFYRINNDAFIKVDATDSFSIPVSLANISDADHFVEVYAVDLNGTKSDTFKRKFTVSRSGPESTLNRPNLNVAQKGKVVLEGVSKDPNGVAAIFLSFDNGNTFLRMSGTESWSYVLDSSILADGVYTLLVRSFDKTGAPGDYMALFSVDNTPAEISLVSPKDGDEVASVVNLDGRVTDNLILRSIKYAFKPLDEKAAVLQGEIPVAVGFNYPVDISSLAVGWYNLSIEAIDDAGNISYTARNIQVKQLTQADRLEILFPTQGQKLSGPFNLEGRYYSKKPEGKVILYVNGKVFTTASVNEYGYFSVKTWPADIQEFLPEGSDSMGVMNKVTFKVETDNEGATKISSNDRTIDFEVQGPWVQITSHSIGDFITKRPYLTGLAGYFMKPWSPPVPIEGQEVTALEPEPRYGPNLLTQKQLLEQPFDLMISLNNGETFEDLSYSDAPQVRDGPDMKGVKAWRYRIETQNFSQGDISFLIRAVFPDGTSATSRIILTIDEVAPEVALFRFEEEGSFNGSLKLVGTAFDETGIAEVGLLLRKGDKFFTQKPAFIQGMYYDIYALGATIWSTGIGLTFFDQAVKIQAQIGYALPTSSQGELQRFYGMALGAKLLANVFVIPWSSLLGPDFEAISSSGSVGANFSRFSMSPEIFGWSNVNPEIKDVYLSAFVAQLEMLRFSFPEWGAFNSYSFYLEGSFWLISSDVFATVVPRISLGFRVGLL